MNRKPIDSAIEVVRSTPELPADKRSELIQTLESIPRPLDTDPWIYRIVVSVLGLVVLITVIGGIILTWIGGASQNFQIPQGIVAIGSAAVGALTGLLAPSPRQT